MCLLFWYCIYKLWQKHSSCKPAFFLMLHCFLLFLQNNSIILSFPFLVINFSHGLPSVSELVSRDLGKTHVHTNDHSAQLLFIPHHSIFFFCQMISFFKHMNKRLIKEMVRECTILALCWMFWIEKQIHSSLFSNKIISFV